MPRYYNFKKHYTKYRKNFFILDWFIKRIMKQGKKSVAIQQVKKCFNLITKLERKNAYNVFLTALYMVGPRIGYYTLPTPEGNIEYIENELNFLESAKYAINIILHNCNKRREKKFYEKLAFEIIDSFYGNSASVKEKESIENEVIKKITEQFDLESQIDNYE